MYDDIDPVLWTSLTKSERYIERRARDRLLARHVPFHISWYNKLYTVRASMIRGRSCRRLHDRRHRNMMARFRRAGVPMPIDFTGDLHFEPDFDL